MGLTAAPVQQATEPSRAPNPAPSGLWGSVTRLIKPQHALIAYGLITAAIVICAPSVRRLVPVGAPGSDLPNWILGPLFPLAGLHVSDGWDTYSPGLIVLCAIGVIGLPLCWMLVANGTAQIKPKTLIWTVVGLYLLIAIAPPLLSTDVFTYLSGGRLEVLYNVNPYLHGPVVRPQDPIFGWTGLIWLDTPTVYGPLFTLLTAVLTWFGPVASLWVLKVVTAASALACVWLTGSLAQRLGKDPLPAALFVALNPLMLVYTAGGAHNDVIALALLLVAARLLIDAMESRAGLALAMAVGVKATAGLALPFMFVGGWVRKRGDGWSVAKGFVIGSLAVAVLGMVFYGLHWLSVPASIADGTSLHIGELRSIPGFIAGYLGLGPIGAPARAFLFLCGAVVTVLALRASLQSPDGWISGLAVSMMALLVVSTQLHPNYIVLCLPFAALSEDRRVRRAAVALTCVIIAIQVVRGVLPLGVGWPHGG